MNETRLHHVGIIVPNEKQAIFLLEIMGFVRGHSVYVEEYQANCIFGEGNGRLLEFIIPDPDSKLSQYNRGMGGLHHLAIETDNVEEAMAELAEKKIRFIEESPVRAGDLLVNFIPPLMTRGVTIEFVQKGPSKNPLTNRNL